MQYDVLIIGGAITGSAVAYWLTRLSPGLRVLVVERDMQYRYASTALSVASIRQQFTTAVNIKISQFGAEFLKSAPEYLDCDPIPFHENGYLFLSSTEDAARHLSKAASLQNKLGAETIFLSPNELVSRFPWMQFDDITSGSFGSSNEGWFDNMSLLHAFQKTAKQQGCDFIQDDVQAIQTKNKMISRAVLSKKGVISVGAVVNAAGTNAANILKMVGLDLPVEPRKRTVFFIDAPHARFPDAPLIIDPAGYYIRPEGNQWICATVPSNDRAVALDDFTADYNQFEDSIWPKLYRRSSLFDAVKVLRYWVGHYAFNVLDQNAIVGPHPKLKGLFLANGFSGHGLQQAPAVGRGLAEMLVFGEYRSIDLSCLNVNRILSKKPFREDAIV
ncbi:NAD(P)/FAD-dependent oxidoreductase [Pseudaestuariivita rosea]|uniref:NAD(P)/FAD-dependent oxidoreductase n=1 Tax=Pseudaestuariivita rosea TaxID=2763263 RepID=UPI001ABBCEE4|nr:FAD-binding oxidoreductase [Pseudaestuariivita rosea]